MAILNSGYITPYYWVYDPPVLYGNNGTLEILTPWVVHIGVVFSGPSHFRANTHRTPLELDRPHFLPMCQHPGWMVHTLASPPFGKQMKRRGVDPTCWNRCPKIDRRWGLLLTSLGEFSLPQPARSFAPRNQRWVTSTSYLSPMMRIGIGTQSSCASVGIADFRWYTRTLNVW